MDLEQIKGLLDGFEPGALLPDLGTLLGKLELVMRLLVVAGPVIMVVMGLLYLFAAPKEANHHFGYRCYFGMGSVEAWRFTQRVAGVAWTVLGLVMTVVMAVRGGSFAGLNAMDMVTAAIVCVLWEAGVLLAASFLIRCIVAARYNRHGERRGKK